MNPLLVVVLVLCPVIPLLVLRVQARGLRRDRRRHHDEMARLATLTGGRLSTPPADTAPWSARFRPAFESIVTAGPLARMTVFSPPEYPHATDFVRHGRSVRVSEAMLVKQRFAASRGDSHVRWECRIDVPAPTSPRIEIGPNRSAVPHPEKLRLPSELTRHLGVETTDPRFASLVLTPEAVDALVRTWEHLPGVVRLEGGLLFLVTEGGPTAERVLAAVDALIAFLDRVPTHAWPHGEQTPAGPPAALFDAEPPRSDPLARPRVTTVVLVSAGVFLLTVFCVVLAVSL